MVHGVEIVEIVASVRQFRRIQPVYEIVVRGERNRVQSACHQLDAQTLAERAFSAAGRSGDKYDPNLLR